MRPSSLLAIALATLLAAGIIVKSLPPIRTDGARETAKRTIPTTKSVYGAGVALPSHTNTAPTGLLSLP